MTDFAVHETSDGQLVVVGDVDLATAPALAEALAQCGSNAELDLEGCTFFDSSGVAALVQARATAVPGLSIVRASHPVRRVLTMCGLADLLLNETAATRPS